MISDNPLLTLRVIAKDLIDRVGYGRAYSNINNKYPNAPAFKHLDEEVLIQELIDIISQKYSKDGDLEVFIIEDDAIEEKSINGMYTNFSDHSPGHNSIYIVINATMNYCWKKFTVIKELCHVYMDFDAELGQNINITKEHNYRISLEKVFEETKNFKDFDFSGLEDIFDMGEEMFIVLLATELMIPIYEREEVMNMVSQIGQQPINLTANDIAKSMLMPEYILQQYIDLKGINCDPKYNNIN